MKMKYGECICFPVRRGDRVCLALTCLYKSHWLLHWNSHLILWVEIDSRLFSAVTMKYTSMWTHTICSQNANLYSINTDIFTWHFACTRYNRKMLVCSWFAIMLYMLCICIQRVCTRFCVHMDLGSSLFMSWIQPASVFLPLSSLYLFPVH